MTRWSWSAGGRASGCYWVVVSSNPRALAEDIAPRVDRVERARPCHQRREGRAPRVSTRRRRSGCSSRARRCGGRAPGAGTRSAPRPPRTSPRTSSRASWYVPSRPILTPPNASLFAIHDARRTSTPRYRPRARRDETAPPATVSPARAHTDPNTPSPDDPLGRDAHRTRPNAHLATPSPRLEPSRPRSSSSSSL